jgi:hypothetical protein
MFQPRRLKHHQAGSRTQAALLRFAKVAASLSGRLRLLVVRRCDDANPLFRFVLDDLDDAGFDVVVVIGRR